MGDRASADSLRWNLDLVLDQRGARGADIADLPGDASGMLVREGKERKSGSWDGSGTTSRHCDWIEVAEATSTVRA
jgi:hypothetical protein